MFFLTFCFALKMNFNSYFIKQLNESNFYCYSFLLSSLFCGIISSFGAGDTLNYLFFCIIILLYANILLMIMKHIIFVKSIVDKKAFKFFPSYIRIKIEIGKKLFS